MKIILRTHGGLGNQIFQIFYARLLSIYHGCSLVEMHDINYINRDQRNSEINRSNINPLVIEKFISTLRIPKIINKSLNSKIEEFRIFNNVYLDGYFQSTSSYKKFSKDSIAIEIENLRNELSIKKANRDEKLIHFRVGDFFKNENESIAHILERFKKIQNGSYIITNREELLRNPQVSIEITKKNCQVIESGAYSPEQLLRLIASFKSIDSNNSTLVFWASILGMGNVSFSNITLKETHYYLQSLA